MVFALVAISTSLLGYAHISMATSQKIETMTHNTKSSVQCVVQCSTGNSQKVSKPEKRTVEDDDEPNDALLSAVKAVGTSIVLGIVLSPLFRRSCWRPPDFLVLYNRSLLYA